MLARFHWQQWSCRRLALDKFILSNHNAAIAHVNPRSLVTAATALAAPTSIHAPVDPPLATKFSIGSTKRRLRRPHEHEVDLHRPDPFLGPDGNPDPAFLTWQLERCSTPADAATTSNNHASIVTIDRASPRNAWLSVEAMTKATKAIPPGLPLTLWLGRRTPYGDIDLCFVAARSDQFKIYVEDGYIRVLSRLTGLELRRYSLPVVYRTPALQPFIPLGLKEGTIKHEDLRTHIRWLDSNCGVDSLSPSQNAYSEIPYTPSRTHNTIIPFHSWAGRAQGPAGGLLVKGIYYDGIEHGRDLLCHPYLFYRDDQPYLGIWDYEAQKPVRRISKCLEWSDRQLQMSAGGRFFRDYAIRKGLWPAT